MRPAPRIYTAYIDTTPEQLWTALTASAFTRRYFDFMEGFMAVDSSWRPGAPVRYRTANGQIQIDGTVFTAEKPTRLEMTLSLRYDQQVRQERATRLRWEITAVGEVCRLAVIHEDADGAPRTAQDMGACMPSILSNLKILLETGRPRLIKAVVVDCAVPATVAAFWVAALGYVMQGPPAAPEDNFVGAADPTGTGPELGFQRVPEAKSVKNRLHLDLHVADRAAEVERLTALGARKGREFQSWTVMTDPEGNEFCVADS